jgi:hypothetical protein
MRFKKFKINENSNDDFKSKVFNLIEEELMEIEEDEREDFLKSIISFCNIQLKDNPDGF